MKKILIALLMGMMLCPAIVDAKAYKVKKGSDYYEQPIRSLNHISVIVMRTTGNMTICPNYNITGLQITIESSGVTYYDTTVSLSAGQAYHDCLDFLEVGEYTMILKNSDDEVIDLYTVTVEDD